MTYTHIQILLQQVKALNQITSRKSCSQKLKMAIKLTKERMKIVPLHHTVRLWPMLQTQLQMKRIKFTSVSLSKSSPAINLRMETLPTSFTKMMRTLRVPRNRRKSPKRKTKNSISLLNNNWVKRRRKISSTGLRMTRMQRKRKRSTKLRWKSSRKSNWKSNKKKRNKKLTSKRNLVKCPKALSNNCSTRLWFRHKNNWNRERILSRWNRRSPMSLKIGTTLQMSLMTGTMYLPTVSSWLDPKPSNKKQAAS